MCQASKVSKDWVVKGCHVHIGDVELAVFPDHKGGVDFKPVFNVTANRQKSVAEALKVVRENCLPDSKVRERWIRSLKQATTFMLSYDDEPSSLANGRMLEFKFLRLALERYTE